MKKYNSDNNEIENIYHPSEANFLLDDIQLDYDDTTVNKNGNEIGNYPYPKIAKQNDILYYIDDNSIKKIDVSTIPITDDTYSMNLGCDLSQFSNVQSISVYKNYVYFLASDNESASIYRLPTRNFGYTIGIERITECEFDDYFIIDGILYFLKSENNSATVKQTSVYSIDLNNELKELKILDVGEQSSYKDIDLIGVDDHFIYFVNYNIERGFSTESYVEKFTKYDISTKKTKTLVPENKMRSSSYQICDGKVYTKTSSVQLALDRVFGSENASYYEMDFEKEKISQEVSDVASSIRYFFDSDDILISGKGAGTYTSTKAQLREGKGVKLTDDYLANPYVFDNDIFYYYDDGLYHIDCNGYNWCKIADVQIE